MDKSGYIRIKPDFLLRGWQGLPFSLVKRGSGRPYFMKKDVFRTILHCNLGFTFGGD